MEGFSGDAVLPSLKSVVYFLALPKESAHLQLLNDSHKKSNTCLIHRDYGNKNSYSCVCFLNI